jgi:uncharacterized protein (DUF58 family)
LIRLAIVILILAVGYDHGGWYGVLAMLLILALVLAPFAYGEKPQQAQQMRRQDPDFSLSEQTDVRKGQRVDPTRPTEDDFAGMITNNYGKRKK